MSQQPVSTLNSDRSSPAAIRERVDLFEQLAANAPVAIFVKDREGRYTLANRLACEALGRPDAVGLRDDEMLDAKSAQRIRQHDLEVINSGRAIENEERVERGNFRQDYLAVKFPLYGAKGQVEGVCGIAVDITERRQAIEELHSTRAEIERQRRLYETILTSTEDLVSVLDLEGRYTYANSALLELWGKPLDEFCGKTNFELGLPEWQATMHQREIEFVITEKRPVKGEVPYESSEGTRIFEYIFVPVLGSTDDVEAVVASARDITERKQIEDISRVERERFRNLADQAPVGIFQTDLDGRTIFVNEAWCELAGMSRESAGGDGWIQAIHPDDRQRVLGGWQTAHDHQRPSHAEYRFRRPDGSTVWLQGNAEPLRESNGKMVGYIGTVVDITSRKLAEQALSENEQRVSAELASMNSLYDLTTRLLATQSLKSALEEVLATAMALLQADLGCVHLYDPISNAFRVAAQHGFDDTLLTTLATTFAENSACGKALSSGKRAIIEDVTLDPSYHDLLPFAEKAGYRAIQSTPLRSRSGSLLGILSTHFRQPRKLTARELTMLDLYARQAADFIEQMQLMNSLREADRRKDEFLAMLAHELRNPLAPIRSGLDYLSIDDTQSQEIVGIMRDQVDHLVRLVDDLLDVSRIVRGKVELRPEIVEVGPLVTRAVESLSWALKAKEQYLDVTVPDEPIYLHGDPVRIVQVLGNLLNNASKYTHEGGHIQLAVFRQASELVVQVRDNGIGIEHDLLPRVFDMFIQSSRALDRSQGGMGIGLTLVRSLVEAHQGCVVAESQGIGRGSCFTITLPLTEQIPATKSTHKRRIGPPRRILVVDDNYGAARLIVMLLKKLGDHKIEMVHNGPSAVEAIESTQPDLVLLDIGLPGMNGYDAARAVRNLPIRHQPFLVALTGYGRPEDLDESRAAGFDKHLVKPPTIEMLEELLAHPRLSESLEPQT